MQKAARFVLVALFALLRSLRRRPRTPRHACRSDSSTTLLPVVAGTSRRTSRPLRPRAASVIHTTATWATIAPTRPATPPTATTRPTSSATSTSSSSSQACYGLRVMINVTGTPKWANGSKTPNHLPTRLSDLTTFTKMLATRYNGRTGHGTVGLWSVWNEPNIQLFLTPQYVGQEDRRPRELREALQGGVRGHQGRQPAAKVAIGETSARGRDKPLARRQRHRSRRRRSRGCSHR